MMSSVPCVIAAIGLLGLSSPAFAGVPTEIANPGGGPLTRLGTGLFGHEVKSQTANGHRRTDIYRGWGKRLRLVGTTVTGVDRAGHVFEHAHDYSDNPPSLAAGKTALNQLEYSPARAGKSVLTVFRAATFSQRTRRPDGTAHLRTRFAFDNGMVERAGTARHPNEAIRSWEALNSKVFVGPMSERTTREIKR
jgi:hypothetical protein